MNQSPTVSFTSSTDNVYIYDDKVHGWIPGRVISSSDGFATVEVHSMYEVGDEECKVVVNLSEYPSTSLPLQNVNVQGELQEVRDMVDLAFLHEAGILYNLKARHERGAPYTRTGEIIIAVNPYEWNHDNYSADKLEMYCDKLIWTISDDVNDNRTLLDPHVYETSSLAYRGLASDQSNQSILVSGESGAGKTETVKILMSHLSSIQSEGVSSRDVIKRVLDSNPLLEAFGNAQTLKNDNSSRFGKFLQLQWHVEDLDHAAHSGTFLPSCTLAGSVCSTYLLEKSRVIFHEESERNYHIFYQLLSAPEEHKAEIWEGLLSKTEEDFSYLGNTKIHVIEGCTDSDRFLNTIESLKLLGLSMDVIYTLFRALSIVLLIGNIRFACDETSDEQSYIANEDELESLAALMGVSSDTVKLSVTVRTIITKHEVVNVPLHPTVAKDSCDALAKEIYSVTFDWLVKAINDATCAESNYENARDVGDTENYGIIGLLDIFGFESFEVNRFEQMCINYANEKLQQKFTTDMFKSVQEEYSAEGIDLGDIQFTDNQGILNLVEGPLGLLSILNEECVRPKGNDVSFVMKIYNKNTSNYLVEDRLYRDYEFCIHHYAGKVLYDARNFVKKNMDTLPQDLLHCISKSSNTILQSEFMNLTDETSLSSPPRQQKRHGSLVQQTVSTKFRNQLTTLMHTVSQTKARYIRCIKPNSLKKPRILDHMSTVEQLRSAGVVAAISISRASFPNRLKLEMVWYRFSCLVTKISFYASYNVQDHSTSYCLQDETKHDDTSSIMSNQLSLRSRVNDLLRTLLRGMDVPNNEYIATRTVYTCGRTRAYFSSGALEFLELLRHKKLDESATSIQCCTRRFMALISYRKIHKHAVLIQTHSRMMVKRRCFLYIKKTVTKIQCWVRCIAAKQYYFAIKAGYNATIIQSFCRMRTFKLKLQEAHDASILIQTMLRKAITRIKYKQALSQARENAKIENRLQVLQLKFEQADRRRLEAEKVVEQKAQEAQNKTHALLLHQSIIIEEKESVAWERKALETKQQDLMDESHKMIDYLRHEVTKLKQLNVQLASEVESSKKNNQLLTEANSSAGVSFYELNQHADQLIQTNATLTSDVSKLTSKLKSFEITQTSASPTTVLHLTTSYDDDKNDEKISFAKELPHHNALDQIVVLEKKCTSFSTYTVPTHSYYKSSQDKLRSLRNDDEEKLRLVTDALGDITQLMDDEEVMKAQQEIKRREDSAREKIFLRRRMIEQHRQDKQHQQHNNNRTTIFYR